MKRNRKLALALALGAALLTLSGCDGTQDGTIDYIDGHWVFTSTQTEQQTDITQLLASPDVFYAAASAMSDEELQSSFDRLTSGQCAELFRSLGEERAMALAGRLTQPQVERLLSVLNGQERIQSLTDPAALAAVWQTLTTDEQLMALSSLSSEDYAALWALLDGATPSPVPDAALPEATAAPDMTDPAYLASIWHTLTQQEQSDVLGGLSSAQFVALWSLLDAQGSAASGEATPAPSDGGADAQQTPEPQPTAPQTPEESSEIPAESVHDSEGASAQESDASPSSSPDTEQAHIALPTDPAALAEVWFTLSPQEQMSAITALTADQFVSLQELLSTRPRPTPAEEEELFVPTPKPTVKRTPTPTLAPTAPPDETQTEPAEPDLSDPAYLASIWHTLSPQEQLSILSTLTIEQYTALQELLAQLSDDEGGDPNNEDPTVEERPAEKPDRPDEGSGDGSTPEEETPAEKPNDSDEMAGDGLASEEETPAEQPDDPDGMDGDAATPEEETPAEKPDEPDEIDGDATKPEEETPAEQPDESDRTDGDAATPEEETPAEQPDESDRTDSDAATPEEETPAEQPDESDGADGDAATSEEEAPSEKTDESGGTDSDPSALKEETSEEESEDSAPMNLVYLASIWHTLSPSEQLSTLSTLSIDQYHALQELLVRWLNGGEDVPKDAEPDGENVPAEQSSEPVEEVTEPFGAEDGLVQITDLPGQLLPRLFD